MKHPDAILCVLLIVGVSSGNAQTTSSSCSVPITIKLGSLCQIVCPIVCSALVDNNGACNSSGACSCTPTPTTTSAA